MKKINLTVLMVLLQLILTAPCLAQEVEPDGLFSIEGTRWRSCGVSTSLQLGWGGSGSGFNFNIGCSGISYEFDDGKVYSCSNSGNCSPLPASFYIDTPLVGIGLAVPLTHIGLDLLIMQPTGFGVYTSLYWGMRWGFGTGILFKDWPGSPEFGSISPNQGEQEWTLTLEITGLNTRFRDDPPVNITFIPSEGLTVSNITVRSNTEIEFDLQIAADAPLGFKNVIVMYDDGNKIISASNVFEVLPRSN